MTQQLTPLQTVLLEAADKAYMGGEAQLTKETCGARDAIGSFIRSEVMEFTSYPQPTDTDESLREEVLRALRSGVADLQEVIDALETQLS